MNWKKQVKLLEAIVQKLSLNVIKLKADVKEWNTKVQNKDSIEKGVLKLKPTKKNYNLKAECHSKIYNLEAECLIIQN